MSRVHKHTSKQLMDGDVIAPYKSGTISPNRQRAGGQGTFGRGWKETN